MHARVCMTVCTHCVWTNFMSHESTPVLTLHGQFLCVSRRVCVLRCKMCVRIHMWLCLSVCVLKFETLSLKILKNKHIMEAWSYLHKHWWMSDPLIEMCRCTLKGSLLLDELSSIFEVARPLLALQCAWNATLRKPNEPIGRQTHWRMDGQTFF